MSESNESSKDTKESIDIDSMLEVISKIYDNIEKIESVMPFNEYLKELNNKVKELKEMYSASVEMFMLKDSQSNTDYNYLNDRVDSIEANLMFMWTELMTKFPEFEPVDIPHRYKKYIPPRTTNKLLQSFFKKHLKKLNEFMQKENKHYGRNNKTNKTGKKEKRKRFFRFKIR